MRPIRRDDIAGTGQPLNHQAVANYIAKYATKTLTAPGLPSSPAAEPGRGRDPALLSPLPADDHHRLAARPPRHDRQARFRAWAHMLGYGGHFLTKSRRYSVTFGQLRAARADHRRATRPSDPGRDAWGRPLDETVVLVLTITSAATPEPAATRQHPTLSWPLHRQHAHASTRVKPIPVDDSVSTGP